MKNEKDFLEQVAEAIESDILKEVDKGELPSSAAMDVYRKLILITAAHRTTLINIGVTEDDILLCEQVASEAYAGELKRVGDLDEIDLLINMPEGEA